MAHRSHGRGTFLIDLRAGKLGRIRVASGTRDITRYQQLVQMLRQLTMERRWDLLSLVQRGEMSPLQLWDTIWKGKWGELPSVEDVRPLLQTTERWLPTLDATPGTREQYFAMLRGLVKEAPRATLGDLPNLLRTMRESAVKGGRGRVAFNRTRAAASALVRDVLGKRHPLRAAVRDVEPLRENPRVGNPQTPAEIARLAQQLPEHAGTLWTLALTGMRRSEYWPERYLISDTGIVILGQKSQAARRVVPLVITPRRPVVSYWRFLVVLRVASSLRVNVHDLRRTFAYWCEDSGVTLTRVRQYMGHSAQSVTEKYTRHNVVQHLTEDAERLARYVGKTLPETLRRGTT